MRAGTAARAFAGAPVRRHSSCSGQHTERVCEPCRQRCSRIALLYCSTVLTCLSVNLNSRQHISVRHGIHVLVCEPSPRGNVGTRHGIQLLVSEPCLRQRSSARHGIQRWCRSCSGASGNSSSSFCRSSCFARHKFCSGQHNRARLLNQVVKGVRVLPCFNSLYGVTDNLISSVL